MMNNRPQRRDGKTGGQKFADRVEDAAKGLNAVLLVLAIGLAILDFTCFVGFQARAAMPATSWSQAQR